MKTSGFPFWHPEELWRCFRICVPHKIQHLPSGLSLATLFRVESTSGIFALKSFPESKGWMQSRLRLHQILRIASGIDPECIPTPPPISLVDLGSRIWELLPWIEGEHKSWNDLSPNQWGQLARFLARIHGALQNGGAKFGATLEQTQSFKNRSALLKLASREMNCGVMFWPELFSKHPSWQLVFPRLGELVRCALEDLARHEKKVVGILSIHGDPHLGNLLWANGQPVGLVDYLGPIDCAESDIARLSGSHGIDPFECARLVSQEYAKAVSSDKVPVLGISYLMLFSGLVAKLFRWRNWLLEGNVPFAVAEGRLNELLDQLPSAISWYQSRNWTNGV
jgi:hypothetical protein